MTSIAASARTSENRCSQKRSPARATDNAYREVALNAEARDAVDGWTAERRKQLDGTDQRAGVARLAGHDLVQPAGSCWISLSFEGEFNLQPDLNRTGPHGVQWPLRSPRAAHAE